MIVKCLSFQEPYCALILAGLKTIETRTQRWTHRGPTVVCRSRTKPSAEGIDYICKRYLDEATIAMLRKLGAFSPAPLGHAVAIVDMLDCFELQEDHLLDACVGSTMATPHGSRVNVVGAKSSQRFGYRLANLRLLTTPIVVFGALGIFERDLPLEETLRSGGATAEARS